MADLVPLCTCATGAGLAPELRLRDAGIDLLESAKFSARKLALLGVLQLQEDAAAAAAALGSGERGLYVARGAAGVADADAAALLCVLRGVDLRAEPFWGCLLLLLSSHVFLAAPGPVTAASVAELAFLADFAQIQVLSEDADAERNARLLQAFTPRLTWVAVDLKAKEMEGCESPSKFLELRLAALAGSMSSADEDVAAQRHALLLTSLASARDCLVLKASAMATPEGFATPQAFTASKLVAHAADGGAGLQPKPFFGRFLDGSQLLHLARSLAHAVSAARSSRLVLQRLVSNVLANYWRLLVASALDKYTDELHARLVAYERVPITGEYLIDVTERKLSRAKDKQAAGSVVNAGQGSFSVFDEFGNLKRQPTQAALDASAPSSAAPAPALNTGIFSFLKNRAGRAFTKQFSLFPATPPSRKAGPETAAAPLGLIAEDEDAEDAGGAVLAAAEPVESPDDVLAKCTARIKSYSVPLEYKDTPSEAMPVDASILERVHGDALAAAMQLLTPFLVDLRCPSALMPYSELACPLDLARGKKQLLARIRKVRARFERANEVGSTIFCAELLRYLHSVVLRKSETDNEAAQKRQQRMGKGSGSGSSGGGGGPMNKLPLELLTYKANLEAMVSQYNFVARGPSATAVLIGFFQGPVRQRLGVLARHEYDRFAHACDERLESISALEDALQDKQRQVAQITSTTAEWNRQEAEAIADVERAHGDQVAELRREIQRASERVERALADQQALYQSTMHATRRTINTIDKVAEKSRMVSGYLERYEKGHMFSKSWRQYFFVLDHATLTCYRSKSVFEERGAPCEAPVVLSGFRVERSRTDELKIKLLPPEAGRAGMLRFRAPASVGRETWVKRFVDATQLSASPSR